MIEQEGGEQGLESYGKNDDCKELRVRWGKAGQGVQKIREGETKTK